MITGSRKAKINMRTCSLCKTLFKMLLNWTNMNQSLGLFQVFPLPKERNRPYLSRQEGPPALALPQLSSKALPRKAGRQ